MKKQTARNNEFLAALKVKLPVRKFRTLSGIYNDEAKLRGLTIAERHVKEMLGIVEPIIFEPIEEAPVVEEVIEPIEEAPVVEEVPQEATPAPETAVEATIKTPAPEQKAKKKAKAPKKPGIIATIIETLKSGEVSKKEILEALTIAFPEQKTKKKAKAPKKPGIIATIITTLKSGEVSKKEILKTLIIAFPDRDPNKMMTTINVQVPSRLRKDKGLNVIKTENGYVIK